MELLDLLSTKRKNISITEIKTHQNKGTKKYRDDILLSMYAASQQGALALLLHDIRSTEHHAKEHMTKKAMRVNNRLESNSRDM